MQASQFHLNYVQDEDRVFIFARDEEGTEHAFALTRHLFKKVWPALGQTIQQMSEAARRTPSSMMGEVLSIERDGAVSQAQEQGTVSDKPLPSVDKRQEYLTKLVQIRDGQAGAKILLLSDGVKSIRIPLTFERLIVFCDALKRIVEGSKWDLKLAYPWEAPGKPKAEAAAAADAPPTRH